MRAVRFNASIPRYALGLALRRISPRLLWSGLSCTYEAEVADPALPTQEWARVRTHFGGICGSDLGTIHLKTSPYFSPFSSFPFSLGHENVGTIASLGSRVGGWEVGERVVVEPTLWCVPRGIENHCPPCSQGAINRCEHLTEGDVAPGLSLGYCRDTGGSWSRSFVAHTSQLYRVPPGVSDENALLVEPFACGLHAALRYFPRESETVLILGAGTIGLVTLAALRALGSKARLLVAARYDYQAEAARRLGADRVIGGRGRDVYEDIAEATGARLLQPILGRRVPVGGVDGTFECVGSDRALDDALRFTRDGGRVVLVGVPGIARGVDWSSVFDKELEVLGSYIYHHAERYGGRVWKTFDLALHMMVEEGVDLGWIVTHRFDPAAWRQALNAHTDRAAHRLIKGVFEFPQQQD